MSYLFIPGTGGVTFATGTGRPASFVLDILYGRFGGWTDRIVEELSCAHPAEAERPWAPSRTTLLPDVADLKPDRVLRDTAYPPVSSRKYEMWPYDWRVDIRYNATLLLDRLRGAAEPTNILSHSQGGFLVVAASLLCDDAREWHELVGRVCLVAPPLLGTVNAMDALINGANFGNINSDFFKRASRTWPSLYQMFPQWACVHDNQALRSTSSDLWPGEGDDFYALLRRAADFFEWLDFAPFRNMEPSRVMVTLGQSEVANTAIGVKTSENDPPVVLPERVRGDTLVPYDLTFRFMEDSGMRNRVMTVKGPDQADHFRMLGDVRVYHDCDRFLSLP